MELDGHPTQDIIDELQRRGAAFYQGTGAGPDPEALELVRRRGEADPGFWLFIPAAAWETEIDEGPPTA